MTTCTPLPGSAFRYAGSVATSVLPSPVRISAILPWCSTMPPISCTSKWRMPSVRRDASRTAAKASGSRFVEVLAAGEALAELGGLALELLVAQRLERVFQRIGAGDAFE